VKCGALAQSAEFERSLNLDLENPFQMVEAIRKGLPAKAITMLAESLAVPLVDLEKILPVSHRTLQRYEKDQKVLPPDLSDHLVQISKVLVCAEKIFGSREKARIWFKRPCLALGGVPPIDFLDTFSGIGMVEQELGRIQYGVFS
jgi:putative toxin-antitoxin system antitoxin component (TIGR02293 family)